MSKLNDRDHKWDRVRFRANLDDYRPVLWPPLGPYWCSGTGDDYSIVVAYIPSTKSVHKEIKHYWPEATHIDVMERWVPLEYSDRFPEPEWWKKQQKPGGAS